MIEKHDINWYLSEPSRLMAMKPFTRRGSMLGHGYESSKVFGNQMINTGLPNLELTPISQDTYITEYRPDLHHIILNQSIPHIKVVFNGRELPINMMDLTHTASFQKLIHSAHTRNLTVNPLEFNLCEFDNTEAMRKSFLYTKNEWSWRNMELVKYKAVNICKKLGNVGVLFSYNADKNKYQVDTFSYDDGYQIVPNYDEYNREIARSLYYSIDGHIVIDTFDNAYHYRTIIKEDGKSWDITHQRHGFSRCPLLHKRGTVAWEYAESSIELWELMTNIAAITLKRFGTFALVLWGELDEESIKRDSSTLILNLSSDNTNGRQDAKTLDFPEPQTMDNFLKTLEEKISLFSSTSFITPKDITTSNSGGNGIALAMSNDFAVATEGALDWQGFMQDMVYLHQEGLDLENNFTSKYSELKIGAKLVPWSLETNNTKITNLAMEAPYLSTQTILERCPDAAPDEVERVIKERGELVDRATSEAKKNAQKAHNIAVNRNDEIIDNVQKVVNIEPVTINP